VVVEHTCVVVVVVVVVHERVVVVVVVSPLIERMWSVCERARSAKCSRGTF
jgi:hypothetical protein